MLSLSSIRGVGRSQALAREIVLEVAQTVRAGESEREVVDRMEDRFARAKVRRWIHTPYAWFGERTRFGGFGVWEVSALATDRRLEEGEPFVLDAAPLVDGFPADFAYSGIASARAGPPPGPTAEASHQRLLEVLRDIKARLVDRARVAQDGTTLFAEVSAMVQAHGCEVVHDRYPAGVLGHTFTPFPNAFGRLPRIGDGFQPPLLGTYAAALALHHLVGRPYPLINAGARGKVVGLFAVEPHVAMGPLGAKFESILLVDGDETRWLDEALFGPVT